MWEQGVCQERIKSRLHAGGLVGEGLLVGSDVEDGKPYRILLEGTTKVVRVPNQKVVFDESYSLKSATK